MLVCIVLIGSGNLCYIIVINAERPLRGMLVEPTIALPGKAFSAQKCVETFTTFARSFRTSQAELEMGSKVS